MDPRAVLDYASGFSKINNRERFQRDAWEGEAQFDRVHRPSAAAVRKRIDYLYPEKTAAALPRYVEALSALLSSAKAQGMSVVVVKMPLPPQFTAALPGEPAFDEALSRVLASREATFHDFSDAIREARFYFDTDHLNRAGLTQFFARDLKPVLESP